jgi:3-deoxy-7-phosphoheptulonate synthase
MIIVLKKGYSAEELSGVVRFLETAGLRAHISEGVEKTIVGAMGDERLIDRDRLLDLKGVETAIPILKPYKLASREFKSDSTTITLNGSRIGNGNVIVMAGPCAVESYELLLETAQSAKQAGATILRGGAFKPRSSPYAFQGLGRAGLEILSRVRDEVGLPIVTECLSQDDVAIVSEHADIIQIGARNMQNFAMLEKVGKQSRPVLLKRGMMSTVEELLMSAEYILANGNYNVILCERGIRTFEHLTRNTSDIAAVPLLKLLTHLPVIVDPSHATGDRRLVPPLSLAAIAAGADGLIIEIHPSPETAMCDGHQSLDLPQFASLMNQIRLIAQVVGKEV